MLLEPFACHVIAYPFQKPLPMHSVAVTLTVNYASHASQYATAGSRATLRFKPLMQSILCHQGRPCMDRLKPKTPWKAGTRASTRHYSGHTFPCVHMRQASIAMAMNGQRPPGHPPNHWTAFTKLCSKTGMRGHLMRGSSQDAQVILENPISKGGCVVPLPKASLHLCLCCCPALTRSCSDLQKAPQKSGVLFLAVHMHLCLCCCPSLENHALANTKHARSSNHIIASHCMQAVRLLQFLLDRPYRILL